VELVACAAILEVWFPQPFLSMTPAVQSLVVISSTCLGSIIFTIFTPGEETESPKGLMTCPRLYCPQLVSRLSFPMNLPSLSSRIMCSGSPENFALLPHGLERYLLSVSFG
jgi:hypothetical protein